MRPEVLSEVPSDDAIDREVERIVARAPSFTQEQSDRLRGLFNVICECETFGYCWTCAEIARAREQVAS